MQVINRKQYHVGMIFCLLLIASRNPETADEARAIGKTLRGLKLEGLGGG